MDPKHCGKCAAFGTNATRSPMAHAPGCDQGTDFATWAEVMAHARAGKPLYYRAPLDVRAMRFTQHAPGGHVLCTYIARARTIRMWPPGSTGRGRYRTSDPFTADASHLSRFSRVEL